MARKTIIAAKPKKPMSGQDDRPGKEERDLEVEQDEEDRDEVVADVELHPRVLERLEAALVGRELCRVGPVRRQQRADGEENDPDEQADQDEEQDRKVLFQHFRCAANPGRFPDC